MRADQSGILLILGCYAMLVSMDAIVKYLTEAGMPVMQLVWARFVFHMMFALPVLLLFHRNRLRTRRPKLQLVRSLLLFLTTVVFFLALKLVSLAAATAIAFAAPLFLVGLSALFLGEKVGPRRWLGVAAGFAGILIIVRPGPDMDLAYLVPLVAAFIYANYELTTRMTSADDHALTTLFYTPVVGVVAGSAILPFVWVSPSLEAWALMVLCGLLGAGGHFLLIKAFERSEASLLAPFGYSSIIWATLLGWAVFGRLPDGWTFGGAALIIASGLYIWHRERRLHRPVPPTPLAAP
jgi:drug/metabolite transporter (DMT)-like permease